MLEVEKTVEGSVINANVREVRQVNVPECTR